MTEKKINTSESSDSISEEEMLRRLGITENNLAGFNDLKVVPDPDEGRFVVSYPDLPGCITCGDTMEAAIDNARDAKAEWLTAARFFLASFDCPLIFEEAFSVLMFFSCNHLFLNEIFRNFIEICDSLNKLFSKILFAVSGT